MSEIVAGKIDPKSQEVETRRIGLQDRLAEAVKTTAPLDQSCLAKAKAARFDANGEPSAAPRFEDAE